MLEQNKRQKEVLNEIEMQNKWYEIMKNNNNILGKYCILLDNF